MSKRPPITWITTIAVWATLECACCGASASAPTVRGDRPVVSHRGDLGSEQERRNAALLLRHAQERGPLRVIIGLRLSMGYEDDLLARQQQEQRQALRNL